MSSGARVDEGVGDAIGESVERGPRRHELRDEARDVVADDVRDRRIEQPSRGRVGLLHDAVGADGQDRVFDVVEDRVQGRVRHRAVEALVAGEDPDEVVAHRRARAELRQSCA